MPKVTRKEERDPNDRKVIIAKTTDKSKLPIQSYQWWKAEKDNEICEQLISTANYLQKTQQYRIKGASVFSRIYSGKGLMNFALNSKILDTSNQLPVKRPTMNVTQSCVDTIVSRLTQTKPKPTFLTDSGDYKERKLAKELNQFILGEFYRTKAYELGEKALRDACVFGDGLIKVFEKDDRVCLQRTLETELFADKNDSWYGDPRQLIELKLSDRDMVAAMFPDAKIDIEKSTKAYIDGSGESQETIADQIIVVEGWHLPSCDGADDGRHVIVCSAGVILDEEWEKDYFPFVKLPYNPHTVGWFSQGLVEVLMGTQLGIDNLLRQISESINIMGVPMVFIDELSKILETSLNNRTGNIVKFRGTPPIFQNPQSNAPELYEHLMRLIQFAYQISGVSQLSASGMKPQGLNSGEAQRVFMEQQDSRFGSLESRYENMYVDLTYLVIDKAKDIAERTGKYLTVYPGKDGTREVELPKSGMIQDYFVVQCYDESSLPHDPAGRYARLSEMLASQEITLQEFRRLSGFPDLEQSDKLANALEERILQILDKIVEDSDFTPPETFMLDPDDLATKLCVQYINLYGAAKLEEKKMQLLRDWFTQVQTLKQQAMAPPPQAAPPGQPGTNPNAAPPPAAPPIPQSAVSAQ
jgi:hypothetical protein